MNAATTSFYLKIFVNFHCNLKCGHCVHSHISSKVKTAFDFNSLETLKRFILDVKSLNSNLKIYLSGGEPLLSPQFFQIARIIHTTGLTYKTMTNGILLEQRCEQLLEAPPANLWITFNGIGERHDTIVGVKGAYEQLQRSVRNCLTPLRDANIKVGAVLMINHLTYDRLSQDIEKLTAFSFDEVVIQHLSFLPDFYIEKHQIVYQQKFGTTARFCFGEGADGSGIDSSCLHQELVKISGRNYPFPTIIFPPICEKSDLDDYYGNMPRKWRNHRCPRALKEFWILPDGDVTACFAHKIGNIDQTFSQILASDAWRNWSDSFRELTEPLPGCMRCHRLYMD